MASPVRILPEVSRALSTNRPVVALESSVLAQGLPIPANRRAAEQMSRAIRAYGTVPAVTGVVRGIPTVGLHAEELDRFLLRDGIRKVSARDLGPATVERADGATTVAAALWLTQLAGIRVFATGGIGGVHRTLPGAATGVVDESADLLELARAPVVVVCAGAKAILDIPATWERLETLGIAVVGFRTDQLPGFFTARTGIILGTRVDTAGEVASVFRAQRALARPHALLVVQPPPVEYALHPEAVESAVSSALGRAAEDGIQGAAMTPYLLAEVTRLTEGRSLDANLALLEQNAGLAADIAVHLADGV